MRKTATYMDNTEVCMYLPARRTHGDRRRHVVLDTVRRSLAETVTARVEKMMRPNSSILYRTSSGLVDHLVGFLEVKELYVVGDKAKRV